MASFVRAFINANFRTPADPETSFQGKNIIVTGSNVGLGLEAAVKFVVLGAAKVILAVRSLKKGEQAKETIEGRTGRKNVIEVWELDMGSYESIRTFADRATKQLDRLDIAVLNAGVRSVSYEESEYGWEQTLQINTFSTLYLGILLLPKLKASRTSDWIPVLEIVSSGSHQYPIVSPEHLAADNLLQSYSTAKGYRGGQAYSFSKLFIELAMLQLASLSNNEAGELQVIVTSVCPGLCRSDLGRGYMGSILVRLVMMVVFRIFFRTTEAGARTLVSGTMLREKAHGIFWQHDEVKP
jgi:NAD(P)-dependent dehydrogenase (short-subunit alcohol dehydrogenase family)